MGWKVPVVSHWGPAGGRFTELAGPNAKNVHFIQTFSFFGKLSVGEKVVAELKAKYPAIKGPDDITPAVGVANAYDGMQLAALAIAKAGSTNGDAVREGFYKIDRYEGLIKTYVKPFSPTVHDALQADDYVWAQFIDNRILPVGLTSNTFSKMRRRAAERAGWRQENTMLLLSALISGFGLGSMYGLMALGFYDLCRLRHRQFCTGQLHDAGAAVLHLRPDAGLADVAGHLLALAACALYGMLVEVLAVRPFARQGSNAWLMSTVALGIVLDNLVMHTFGKEPRSLPRRWRSRPSNWAAWGWACIRCTC
jgi:hypothetical protein